MLSYNTLQIKYISCYARRLGVSPDIAARIWVASGLAGKFSTLYRCKFSSGMDKAENRK